MEDKENTGRMRCIDRIQESYEGLSRVSQRIADYVLENPQKVVYMTVPQLAEICNVSVASIVRFCKSIDYAGFNEMKINLASEQNLRDRVIIEAVSIDDSEETILKKVFSHEILALQTTLKGIDTQQFVDAVNRIAYSNKVEFFAYGNTRTIAQDACHRFLRIGLDARLGIDKFDSLIHATRLGVGDVAVGISHTGSTKATIQMLESARRNGAVTIAITGLKQSPILEAADISLVTDAMEMECTNVAMTSKIAMLAVIDALVVASAFKKYEYANECMLETDCLAAEDKI